MGFMDDKGTLDVSEPTIIVLDSPQAPKSHQVSVVEDEWNIPETVKKVKTDIDANQISPVPFLLASDDEDDLEELEKQVLSSSWSRRLARSYIKHRDVAKDFLDSSVQTSRHASYVECDPELSEIGVSFDLTSESNFDDVLGNSLERSNSKVSFDLGKEPVSFDLTDDSYPFHISSLQRDTIILTSSDPPEDIESESLEMLQSFSPRNSSQLSKVSTDSVKSQSLLLSIDENEPEFNKDLCSAESITTSIRSTSFFGKKARTVNTSLQEIEFDRVRKELARRKKSDNSIRNVDRIGKEHERQMKKLEREAKKLEKQQQKEQREREKAKERQLREVNNLRLDKLDCCREMIVSIDEALTNTPDRAGITLALEEILVEVSTKACQIPNSIELQRQIKAEFDGTKDMWIPIPPKIKEENTILVILPWENLIEKVGKQELYDYIFEIREIHPGKRIVVIIEGLSTFMKKRKRLESRKFVNQVLTQTTDEEEEPVAKVTRRKGKPKKGDISNAPGIEEVEEQLVWLQMVGKCLLVHTKSIEETNSMVAILIKDISTIPYKKRNTQLKFCIEGQVKSGATAKEVWELMLQQIHLVTPNVARSIIHEYPTLKCLYDAYKRMPTPDEAQLMLQDVVIGCHSSAVSSRRLGPALSKRIYQFFMGQDPNFPIS